jgi:hypothetical protein
VTIIFDVYLGFVFCGDGTSSVTVGIAPRSGSGGAKGPRPTRFRVSVWADIVGAVAPERAAAAVARPFAVADANEEVRL